MLMEQGVGFLDGNSRSSFIGVGRLKLDGFDKSLKEFKRIGRSSGQSLEEAQQVRLKSRQHACLDQVGGNNESDFYSFRLKDASRFQLSLKGLTANADVALLNDEGRVIRTSTQAGTELDTLQINLAPGTYYIQVQATSEEKTAYVMGASAQRLKGSIARSLKEADRNDNHIILDWNTVLLKAIQTDRTAPPVAARNLAIMHTAVYDAVNSILNFGNSYRFKVDAPKEASAEAAAVGAAYQTLISLFPKQKSTFDTALSASLAKIPDGKSETKGLQVGVQIANAILSWRSTDGASRVVPYQPSTVDGNWRPTAPNFGSAVLPQWPSVTPFAMTSGSQFRPASPPSIDSPQYKAEIEQVRSLGSRNSTARTADQTEMALFWSDGAGTYTPPGHWNAIAEQVSRSKQLSLAEDARLFALLNIALADAGIACWDAKYTYNQWRPITAIRQTEPTWTPLITTPSFPDYASGHSTFSKAASTILSNFFGKPVNFSTTSLGTPGVVRSYQSFDAAAEEAGISRILGGIHVQSSNLAGQECGVLIGKYVVKQFLVV